jgi:secreted trypsin-like serine protease
MCANILELLKLDEKNTELNTLKKLSCFKMFSTAFKVNFPALAASSDLNPKLMFVDVTVIDNKECADFHGSDINKSKICVDTKGGSEGVCNGDNGGPLVITESDGKATNVGIVSFGFGGSNSCESGAPAVFTRVSEYLDWLKKEAGVTIRP